jgi:predicted phage tail protein
MLTKVRLDGVMGKKFGKEWELEVSSPAEALRLIEANQPGLRSWIINNMKTYDAYEVICTYEDGREEALCDDTYGAQRGNLSMIRFSPTISGASSTVKIIVGVVLIAVGYFVPGPWSPYLYSIGASLILGGVIEALSPRPKAPDGSGADNGNSYYFDGPANTELQGAPVPLIYGRLLVGSHPISASVTVDEAPL